MYSFDRAKKCCKNMCKHILGNEFISVFTRNIVLFIHLLITIFINAVNSVEINFAMYDSYSVCPYHDP